MTALDLVEVIRASSKSGEGSLRLAGRQGSAEFSLKTTPCDGWCHSGACTVPSFPKVALVTVTLVKAHSILLKMFSKNILAFLLKKFCFENSQQLLKFTITSPAVLTNYHRRWGSETLRLTPAPLRWVGVTQSDLYGTRTELPTWPTH